MKNIDMKVEQDVLTIKIDLTKDYGRSKSGKSIIIASSEGNKVVDGTDIKIGINVYR